MDDVIRTYLADLRSDDRAAQNAAFLAVLKPRKRPSSGPMRRGTGW